VKDIATIWNELEAEIRGLPEKQSRRISMLCQELSEAKALRLFELLKAADLALRKDPSP
jgi:hypothetical protein